MLTDDTVQHLEVALWDGGLQQLLKQCRRIDEAAPGR